MFQSPAFLKWQALVVSEGVDQSTANVNSLAHAPFKTALFAYLDAQFCHSEGNRNDLYMHC
jgi:hypothetical protein